MTLLNSNSSVQIDEMVCVLYSFTPEEMKGNGVRSCFSQNCLQCILQPGIFIF